LKNKTLEEKKLGEKNYRNKNSTKYLRSRDSIFLKQLLEKRQKKKWKQKLNT
jgi:hypothetical protein